MSYFTAPVTRTEESTVPAIDPTTITFRVTCTAHRIEVSSWNWSREREERGEDLENAQFATADDAKAFAALLPKSCKVRGGGISCRSGMYGYVSFHVGLLKTGTTGERNETGVKRYRTLRRALDELGVNVEWAMPFTNALTEEEAELLLAGEISFGPYGGSTEDVLELRARRAAAADELGADLAPELEAPSSAPRLGADADFARIRAEQAIERLATLLDVPATSDEPMRSSAVVCLEDARTVLERGDAVNAELRARKGLTYLAGFTSESGPRADCNACGGDGYIGEPVRDTRSTGMTTRCPACDGTGKTPPGSSLTRSSAPHESVAPRVGDIGYCRHCSEAIIAVETSRSSVWSHRNSGLIMCGDEHRSAIGAMLFATPTPRDEQASLGRSNETTRTYRAGEDRREPCSSCGETIATGERYAISLNRRNQMRVYHVECPSLAADDEPVETPIERAMRDGGDDGAVTPPGMRERAERARRANDQLAAELETPAFAGALAQLDELAATAVAPATAWRNAEDRDAVLRAMSADDRVRVFVELTDEELELVDVSTFKLDGSIDDRAHLEAQLAERTEQLALVSAELAAASRERDELLERVSSLVGEGARLRRQLDDAGVAAGDVPEVQS